MKASDAVAWAHNEIGITEYPPDSNNVKYNTWMYGREVSGSGYPWCCAFVSWIFRDHQDLCRKTASCQDLLAWYEAQGAIVKKPIAGDIVFFKFKTNNRRTNHVGICVGSLGSNIYTIEGNTSLNNQDNGGAVLQRIRSSNMVAFARPCYEDAWITVKKGSKGVYVKKLQHLLNIKYDARLVEDGDFGNQTAIKLLSAQGMMGEVKDAIAGERTWSKLI